MWYPLHKRFDCAKRCWRWKWPAFRFIGLDPLVHNFAQFGIHRSLVAAMHATQHQSWTAADVTLILFTPGNHFHVPIRRFAHDLARSIARLREPALSLSNGFLIMFRIVSRRSRERDPHAAGMQEVPIRPFTSPIHKPIAFPNPQ
jgi:hypothetical protein